MTCERFRSFSLFSKTQIYVQSTRSREMWQYIYPLRPYLSREQTSYHSYSGLLWTVAYWTNPIWWSLHKCWTCNGRAGDSIYRPLKRRQAECICRPFDRVHTISCSVQSTNRTVRVFSYVFRNWRRETIKNNKKDKKEQKSWKDMSEKGKN